MIWSVYVPLVSLVLFVLWMLRLSLRARSSLREVSREIDGIGRVLADLKATRRLDESRDTWLSETYATINRSPSAGRHNPLAELVSRVYAMRELASPDMSAVLESISERELDKLEVARETPNSLLLVGIMGTVTGLVIALSTFGVAGILGDGADIDIGRIMGSALLAFISTGIALFLSVLIRSFSEKVADKQSSMLSDLEGYAFTHLAPFLLPKHDSAVQQSFHDLMDNQQALLEISLEKTTAKLADIAKVIESTYALSQDMSNAVSQNADAIRSEVTGGLINELRLVAKDLEKQRTGLGAIYRDTMLNIERKENMRLQEATSLRQGFAETLKVIESNNLELVKSVNAMTSNLATRSGEQTNAVNHLRQDVIELGTRLHSSQEEFQQTFMQTVQSFLQRQFDELARSMGVLRRR